MLTAFISILIYGFIHSLLASTQVKTWVCRAIGTSAYKGLYRFSYTVIASIGLMPITWMMIFDTSKEVWRLGAPWNIFSLILRGAGLAGFLLALRDTDQSDFVGMRQFWRYITRKSHTLPKARLVTTGFYRYTRHPLYFFGLMILWPVSSMTERYLGFCIGVTLYIFVGSYHEERRLLREFNLVYARYRKQVPWLIPLPRISGSSNLHLD